jgi:hypothetical protein
LSSLFTPLSIALSPATSFSSTATMHMLVLYTLVMVAIVVNIGYVNGATCTCSCCIGTNCIPIFVGRISVSYCSSCTSSLCRTAYSTRCLTSSGVTRYYCSQSNDARRFFEASYQTTLMVMISLAFLIYRKIY